MAAGMVSSLEDWITELELNRHKATDLKYARSYMYRYMDSLVRDLPQEEMDKIWREVKRKRVGFYCKEG